MVLTANRLKVIRLPDNDSNTVNYLLLCKIRVMTPSYPSVKSIPHFYSLFGYEIRTHLALNLLVTLKKIILTRDQYQILNLFFLYIPSSHP